MNSLFTSNRLVKVQKVSRVLRAVCWVMMAGVVLVALGILFPRGFRMGETGQEWIMVSIVSVFHLGALIGIYFLERLFRSLSQGRVFDADAIGWLKRFGYWMLIMSGATLLLQSLPILFAARIPVAVALMQLGYPLGWLFVGLFVVVLAWLLEEARDIKEEQALTV